MLVSLSCFERQPDVSYRISLHRIPKYVYDMFTRVLSTFNGVNFTENFSSFI